MVPWRGQPARAAGPARPLALLREPGRAARRCQWLTGARPQGPSVEAFAVSTLLVAIAEIGDKTQLLSLVLACRFRRPLPIIAAIFVATLANHAMAGVVGSWIAALIGPAGLR